MIHKFKHLIYFISLNNWQVSNIQDNDLQDYASTSHFLHDNFHSTKHQSTYLKKLKGKSTRGYFLTTKANSSEQEMHEKQELEA